MPCKLLTTSQLLLLTKCALRDIYAARHGANNAVRYWATRVSTERVDLDQWHDELSRAYRAFRWIAAAVPEVAVRKHRNGWAEYAIGPEHPEHSQHVVFAAARKALFRALRGYSS